jgi:nicotinamide-nucleotide amidase
MIADIITIGDELLSGENLNTNSKWLGWYLTNQNIEIRQAVTVSDQLDPVKQALRVSLNEVDLVILTGGLGPTRDDKTKEALQDLFQKPLTRHEPTLAHIKEYFKQKGRQLTESNYRQADVLSNCDVLFNKQGTAPGMWFEVGGVGLAVLPGVPYEMKHLMREKVQTKIERLQGWRERTSEVIHYLQTAGVGESTLSDSVLPRLNEYESDKLTVAFYRMRVE